MAETDYVAVLLGNGDGTVGTAVTYAASEVLLAVDVNGDNVLDLVTASGVMLGNGDGSFQPEIPISIGGQALAGDFNHHGKVDLLTGDVMLVKCSPPEKMFGRDANAYMTGVTSGAGVVVSVWV